MSRDFRPDPSLDRHMTAWLDERAHGGDADAVLDAALARTNRTQPLPAWLLPERWIPMQITARLQPVPRVLPIFLLIALAAAVIGIAVIGSQRRLPPPFGLAANGRLAYVSNGHIFTAEAGGEALYQVTSNALSDATPVFSRDGMRIAFKRLTANNPANNVGLYGDLVVANADGSDPITIDAGTNGMSPVVWSPDDRILLYSRGSGPDRENVYLAAADGSSPPRLIGDRTSFAWGPGWSPKGDPISFASGGSNEQLFVMKQDGSEIRQLTHGSWRGIDGVDPWNPDGRSLLFAAGDYMDYALWTVGLDGVPERIAAPHVTWEGFQTWSPDGTRIAYLERVGDRATVHVCLADGTGDRTLPATYGWIGLGWSPDGTKLVATDDATVPPRVLILDAVGTAAPVEITTVMPAASALAIPADTTSWQRLAAEH